MAYGYPKLDPDVWRDVSVLRRYAALNLDSATHCIDRTGELDQHAIASGLDDATSMGGYDGIKKGLSDGF